LKLTRLAIAAGDVRMTVTGTIRDYAAPGRYADLELSQGTAGQQGLDWIRARFRLPAEVMPRPPVEIAAARVQWPGVGRNPMAAEGRIRIADAVDAEFDLAWQPGDLELKRLVVKDAVTDMTAALRWRREAVDVSFDGTFDGRTVTRMLAHPAEDRGSVRGVFHAAVDRLEPQRSRATGTAEAEGVDLAIRFGLPVVVERLRLEGQERQIRVQESDIVVAGQRVELTGSVEGRERTLAIDGRLIANKVDAERLVGAMGRLRASGGTAHSSGGWWDLPLEGRIALEAEGVSFGTRALHNVKGTASFSPNRVVAQVTEAQFCGANLPFTATLSPGVVEATARPAARGQSLEQLLRCLGRDELEISGTYDLDGEFSARGPVDALVRAARGSFRFAARAGRVRHSEALVRTLAVGEVAARMDADAPKVMAQGLEYDEFTLAGSIESGRLHLDQGMLDSPRLGATFSGDVVLADGRLALQALVAPIDRFHRAMRRVPILGRVTGTSLVVVPVSITGTVSDPQVKVQSAAAIGATLINLMSARFLLPVDLLDIHGAGPPRKP
jgi:hypothetical protein